MLNSQPSPICYALLYYIICKNLETLIIHSASCCCSWSSFQFLQSDCSSSASTLFLTVLERPLADPPMRIGVRGPCGESDSDKFPFGESPHWSWIMYKASLLASSIEETGNLLTWSLYFCITTQMYYCISFLWHDITINQRYKYVKTNNVLNHDYNKEECFEMKYCYSPANGFSLHHLLIHPPASFP